MLADHMYLYMLHVRMSYVTTTCIKPTIKIILNLMCEDGEGVVKKIRLLFWILLKATV